MNKVVYCSECGTRLEITRKAVPSCGRVVDLIPPHVCTDEPVEFDFSPIDIPSNREEVREGKFVQKLNELPTKTIFDSVEGDRRSKEFTKPPTSSAPDSILRAFQHTTPARGISELEDSEN